MNIFLNDLNIHKSWENFLTLENMKELDIIYQKIKDEDFFPNNNKVLRFLELDLNNIKYIIMGMEPYPSYYMKNNMITPEATGRSFEVSSILDKTWQDKFKQSSLRNILKTIYYNETNELIKLEKIREKIKNNEFKISQPKEWFNNIENQGVLFLNATLTVKANNVDSHTKYWETFMNHLLTYIYKNNHNIKFLLWGNKAIERVSKIIPKDNYICSCHPRLNEFILENCFKYIKDINWLG